LAYALFLRILSPGGNPGYLLQVQHGGDREGMNVSVAHPITLLAEAYRKEIN
jgi:Fe-S oxidoreductase